MNNPQRVYVFRIDYGTNNPYIREELQAGRLRQGWGGAPLKAPDQNNDYDPTHYTNHITAAWGITQEEAHSRYHVLHPMLNMQPGDLIVIPKYPDPYGRAFAIAQATGHYTYKPTHHDDYGHVIPINPTSIRVFDYNSTLAAKLISGKFTAYQRAINNTWNTPFIESVQELHATPIAAPASTWKNEARNNILHSTQQLIRELPPHALEDLVRNTFTKASYTLQRTNHYDSRGGDADLVLTINLPLLSEAINSPFLLFIQVKKRNGEDNNDLHGLQQLTRIAADEPMSLKALFTTADTISDEAAAYAQAHGIVLIHGAQALAFLTQGLITT